jgi:hypothetical protein
VPQLRQPTFRCLEDDLGLARPPLSQPLCRLIGETEAAPARKLLRDFCHDKGPAEQGRRVASVSDAAGVPVFRRKHSETRGLTWHDRDAANQMPEASIVQPGHPDPGIEWMLLIGMRRADAVYNEGTRLANASRLLPAKDDYLRAHAEFAAHIAQRLPDAVRELLKSARECPGVAIEGTIAWNIPAKVRVEYDDQVNEIRIALPRAASGFVDQVETAMLMLLENESGLVHEEIVHPHLIPGWVPSDWRCFHFVTESF